MKLSPGDFGIEDVQDFFGGLESVKVNPAENIKDKWSEEPKQGIPNKTRASKPNLFPSGKRIVIKKGIVQKIDKREQNYEGRVYYQYLLYLKDGEYELENEEERIFKELIAQISENLYNKMDPQIGDSIYCKGRTKNDWSLGDIVHNIRSLKII
jgi:hypothetical protein